MINRLKEIREARGLTLEDVAEVVGYSVSYVQRLENEKRNLSVKHLPKFAKALSVDQRELISVNHLENIALLEERPEADPPPALEWIGMPDGEKVNIDTLTETQRRILQAACTGQNAEVWRLTSNVLNDHHEYQPGVFAVVEIGATPKSGDFVLAEYDGCPIFRYYSGVRLYVHGSPLTNPIDRSDPRLKIRGVVRVSLPL